MKVTKPILVSWVAFALMLGSFTKEVNAQNVVSAPGGSTGWEPVSTIDESTCAAKAVQKMNSLVATGEIKTVLGYSSRYARGNAVLNIVCHKDGKYVRVDVICFGPCEDGIVNNGNNSLRSKIEQMLKW